MFLDFFFPRRCLNCKRKGGYLCNLCKRKLEHLDNPLFLGETSFFQGAVSVFPYQNKIVQILVKKYKFGFLSDLKFLLGELVFDFLDKEFAEGRLEEFCEFISEDPLVVGVPLHKKRFAWRGFNQAEMFGEELAGKWNLQFEQKVLQRTKNTIPQSELAGKKRRKNVQGVFELRRKIEERNILLIDDVWTTGATMKECARELKKGGAEEVWGLSLCRSK